MGPDLSRLRAAVQLRDRCRAAALDAHGRAGLTPSGVYANATFDAIADLIREDETASEGYEQAIATLRDVAHRTGSPAARWAADYLATDPDKLAPADAVR